MLKLSKGRWINTIILTTVCTMMFTLLYFSTPPIMRNGELKITIILGCIGLFFAAYLSQWMMDIGERKKAIIKNGYQYHSSLENGHEIWIKRGDSYLFIDELDEKGYVVSSKRYDERDMRNFELLSNQNK